MHSPLLFLIPLSLLLLAGGALAFMLQDSRQLLPVEVARTPLHSQSGGVVAGSWHVSSPLARIAVYPDVLVVATLGGFTLAAADIIAAELVGSGEGQRVRVAHRGGAAPTEFFLTARDPFALYTALSTLVHASVPAPSSSVRADGSPQHPASAVGPGSAPAAESAASVSTKIAV